MRSHLSDSGSPVESGPSDAWRHDMVEQAKRTEEMAQRVAALSVTATGVGGAVEVTVSGSGLMTGLRLDEQAMRWRPEELAEEIMVVLRQAQSRLVPLVEEVADETLGPDSAMGRGVVAGFVDAFATDGDRDGGGRWDGRG